MSNYKIVDGIWGIGEIQQDGTRDITFSLTWHLGWSTLAASYLYGLQEVVMDFKLEHHNQELEATAIGGLVLLGGFVFPVSSIQLST